MSQPQQFANPHYNPYTMNAVAQQRLNNMEMAQQQNQQQFHMPQQNVNMMQPQQPQIPFLRGRLVTSIDEAKASMIDFDGSIFIFPDIANGKVYTKRINNDGLPEMKAYSLDAPESPQKNETKSIDINLIYEKINDLDVKIESLMSKEFNPNVSNLKKTNNKKEDGGNNNAKSNANDSDVSTTI